MLKVKNSFILSFHIYIRSKRAKSFFLETKLIKILDFLTKCLKVVVNMDVGEAHEKRGGKGGIKILKTYL